jgi:hypothetical protein
MNKKQTHHDSGRCSPVIVPKGYPQHKSDHYSGLHQEPTQSVTDHRPPISAAETAVGSFFFKKKQTSPDTNRDPADYKTNVPVKIDHELQLPININSLII